MIGSHVGPYYIEDSIGQGGMAAVYRAYDPSMERRVAVKVLPAHFSQDPRFLERFRQEAKAIANLEHTHILPVYNYGEQDGTAYLVMRLMDTGTLRDRIAAGPMDFEEISRILRQVASALDHAHRNGIIHRDVKPGNVLLSEDGDAYLTDFGIAKMVEGAPDLTGTGMAVGTPQYMSPEQAWGRKDLTPATDIYSLGVVLFQMVTGRVPFEADTPMGVIQQHLNEPPPSPTSVRPDLHPEIARVILKALDKHPEQRHRTTVQLSDDFQRALNVASRAGDESDVWSTIPTEVAEPTRPQTPMVRKQRSFRRLPSWALGLVAAAIVVGLGVVATRFIEPDRDPNTPTPTPDLGGAAILPPTDTPTPTATPYPAATGKIVFVSYRDGNNEIYVMNADGTEPFNLTNDPADDSLPVWAPDRGRIAFVSNRSDQPDIYTMDGLGNVFGQLTDDPAAESALAWSPTGPEIAYESVEDGNIDIYVVNAFTAEIVRLTSDQGADQHPVWSPDGSRIAFMNNRGGGNSDIFVINADGSELTQITNHVAPDSEPSWSPDGSRIAFTSAREGSNDIYAMSVAGGTPERLTMNGADDWSPVWSPNGEWIAFLSDRDRNDEVYAVDVNSGEMLRLTETEVDEFDLSWSTDGWHLAFCSNESGETSIYSVDLDGSQPVQLTMSNAAFDGHLNWSGG